VHALVPYNMYWCIHHLLLQPCVVDDVAQVKCSAHCLAGKHSVEGRGHPDVAMSVL
jgi:hypothetical protein